MWQGTCLARITKERDNMCKLTIEQGFNRIELEFKSIYQASEVIDFMKNNVTTDTKFIITDEGRVDNEHSREINEGADRD